MAKKESTKLIQMLNEIPIAYFNCTEEILRQNQGFFENKTTNSTILSLTDHIYFLIKRIHNEQYLPNQFGWEIQRYYPKEYKIALHSLEIIEKHFQVKIPEEEASNLVLHFMSIQLEGHSIAERTTELRIIQDITNIVKYELKNGYNENGLSYERFLVHLKFFVRRIFSKEKQDEQNFLYDYVRDNMENSFIYFIHGGGFIAGNFFQYRNQCKLMAERADAVVIACNYRLAPENPYPTNLNDCYEIYQWIITHADTLNIDVEKFYIAGDSAGAGIAISLCLQKKLSIKRLFNLYGCVDLLPTSNENYPFTIDSFPIISAHKELLENKLAKFYHQLNLFIELYLQNNEDFKDPLISPVYATDFSKLPPMVYFEAEFDYFRPSNRYFCELAKEVNIEIYSYRGMDHGFFESLGYADEAEDVINRISEIVRTTN